MDRKKNFQGKNLAKKGIDKTIRKHEHHGELDKESKKVRSNPPDEGKDQPTKSTCPKKGCFECDGPHYAN